MSIGLALSGGGAKGAAHIGVLQALSEEGINIDYISGASSGSIIATLFACGYNPLNILYMFNKYCKHITDYDRMLPFKIFGVVFTGRINIRSLVKGRNLETLIKQSCKQKDVEDIRDIKLPIAVPTVDIDTGEIIYYTNTYINNTEDKDIVEKEKRLLFDDTPSYIYHGNISSVVRASSGFPVVFEPKTVDNKRLVDGGVRVNTPVSVLKKMGADKVIAVSFDDKENYKCDYSNIISAGMRSFDIMCHQVNISELEKADYIIRPKIKNVSLLELNKCNYCATQGYNSVKSNIDEIKKLLK